VLAVPGKRGGHDRELGDGDELPDGGLRPPVPIQDFTQATGGGGGGGAAVDEPAGGNYPNPFNPQTDDPVHDRGGGARDVRVFDVAGRLVNTLVKQVVTRRRGGDALGRSDLGRQTRVERYVLLPDPVR